ncbi:endo-1,4-beta-xylanase [Microbacterium karelineae]|uniref:endo-1,4-beta-xylanase n=1 Tax=Microbacterium karelineae TaxID=2654283 RepID=UPI0012E9F0A9|nr:endo-1,4-beta-xylanase [Microbacterium karelineae]
MTNPRATHTTLTLRDADGAPLAHRDVTVAQTRHAFGFGCTGFEFIEHATGEADRTAFADAWLGLFDTATLPFYWGRFEPERGAPDTARLRQAARWLRERGVRLKGHPLVWHTVKADWLDRVPEDEVERIVRDRVTREASDFAGLVDTWDAINEVAIMPRFDNEPDGVPGAIPALARSLGRTGIIRLAFETARAANPQATLLINDFDLSEDYERLIEDALEAGVRIDAIGLQTHMHQGYRGEEQLLGFADRFSRFGLPLHFTEISLVSGALMPPEIEDLNDFVVDQWPSTPEGEARQADEITRMYRALATHPSVEAITYWGLGDGGAWLGAPIGLLREDGSSKPAYDALCALVRGEWWHAPQTLRTDTDGRVRVEGWRGDYAVRLGDAERAFALSGAADTDIAL